MASVREEKKGENLIFSHGPINAQEAYKRLRAHYDLIVSDLRNVKPEQFFLIRESGYMPAGHFVMSVDRLSSDAKTTSPERFFLSPGNVWEPGQGNDQKLIERQKKEFTEHNVMFRKEERKPDDHRPQLSSELLNGLLQAEKRLAVAKNRSLENLDSILVKPAGEHSKSIVYSLRVTPESYLKYVHSGLEVGIVGNGPRYPGPCRFSWITKEWVPDKLTPALCSPSLADSEVKETLQRIVKNDPHNEKAYSAQRDPAFPWSYIVVNTSALATPEIAFLVTPIELNQMADFLNRYYLPLKLKPSVNSRWVVVDNGLEVDSLISRGKGLFQDLNNLNTGVFTQEQRNRFLKALYYKEADYGRRLPEKVGLDYPAVLEELFEIVNRRDIKKEMKEAAAISIFRDKKLPDRVSKHLSQFVIPEEGEHAVSLTKVNKEAANAARATRDKRKGR